MKKYIALAVMSFVLLAILNTAIAYTQATPVTGQGTATVGVNEFISFTITVNDLTFGDIDPGTNDTPATGQPAVTLTVESSTNTDVEISLNGTDFSDGTHTLTLTDANVKYDDDAILGGSDTGLAEGVLTTSYATWTTITAPCGGTAVDTSVYHWITIPSGQHAGDYSGTFSYEGKGA